MYAMRWLAAISIAVTAISLAGCDPEDQPPSSENPSQTVTVTTETPTSTEAPTTTPSPTDDPEPEDNQPVYGAASEVARLTGSDMDTCSNWHVCATDLMIPYTLENGSVGFLGGDTFEGPAPGGPNWRSPVMLRSNVTPSATQPIVFDSAAGVLGHGVAPELIDNAHNTSGHGEFTVIPTDGISFPETGDQIISYMSIRSWDAKGDAGWQTNSAGLAWSPDGNNFYRMGPVWENNAANTDPYQMWSMQRAGDYVYIVSVAAGRQTGPMMLRRVPWNSMLDGNTYQCWNGSDWGGECAPIMYGHFGEPSFRLLSDGTWVLSYLDLGGDKPQIVTQTATNPVGPWSDKKVQVTWDQFPFLYGGYVHSRSTASDLTLIVSTWRQPDSGLFPRYDVTQFHGSL